MNGKTYDVRGLADALDRSSMAKGDDAIALERIGVWGAKSEDWEVE